MFAKDPQKVCQKIHYHYSMDDGDRSSSDLFSYDTVVGMRYDGQQVWKKPVILKSICSIDVEFFPYDDQKCGLKFGSWAHDFEIIDMEPMVEQKKVFYSLGTVVLFLLII